MRGLPPGFSAARPYPANKCGPEVCRGEDRLLGSPLSHHKDQVGEGRGVPLGCEEPLGGHHLLHYLRCGKVACAQQQRERERGLVLGGTRVVCEHI